MLSRQLTFLTKLTSLTLVGSFIFFNSPHLLKAEIINSSIKTKRQEKNSSRNGLPVNRIAGGSRSSCLANNHRLVALVPEENVNLTASNSPKLFFYIPATKNPYQIEFVLRNQNDELVYETSIDTNQQSGIVSISVPNSVNFKGLEVNQNYHWYLSMICDPMRRSHDLVVEGWIRRIELETAFKKQLQNSNQIKQAELYHQKGIWHDALAALAEEPDASQWSELLDSIGLEDLAQQPLIQNAHYAPWLHRDRISTYTQQ
ncbi:protein of unknown function DUF928 [Stanieria cyanosphaera PCC 7437]|uniref:DUF928 domain-containing protein n=1 Tax=Stanieria cyanosphaera (strain ATCC 29371 / PCC 7437) TaxID=111780 RepID=K9XTN0_STAC7|nr:DUF928 domain-containing protein [Stanieria cyanosphaera]AFZ35022.1 protein of unknown function DUF928 [Stanieria cyanosphaera PCC 7437]